MIVEKILIPPPKPKKIVTYQVQLTEEEAKLFTAVFGKLNREMLDNMGIYTQRRFAVSYDMYERLDETVERYK